MESENKYYWKNREAILRKHKENKIYKQPIKFTCSYCGKEDKSIHQKKFCSKECSKKSYKEKYLKAREEGIFPSNNNCINNYLKIRWEILERDNFRCQYCGRNPRNNNCILEIDHIIPRSKGGETTKSNLITSCSECNLGKHDILLEENKIRILIQKEKNAKND